MPTTASTLKSVITDQRSLQLPDPCIIREKSLELQGTLSNNLILILTGLRRSGKSTLLQQIKATQPKNDYYLNFDDERLATFKVEDFQILYELFIELFGEQEHFYFDEIQNIPEWERFVRRLHDYGKKVFITGSNASMLSAELGTRLTGRYQQIELLPFSFREFLAFHNVSTEDIESTKARATLKRYFNLFLEKGGIPGHLQFSDPNYLSDLYEGILYRDIAARYKLNKVSDLKELVYHAASNIAKPFNYTKLKQMLAIKHATTIKDYLYFLEQSFLIFLVSKFDFSSKRQLLAPKKLYCIDTALAQVLGFRHSADLGRLLENVVYLELRRQNYKVHYFSEKHECDFIIRNKEEKYAAIQVTASLHNPETYEREIAGLEEAMQFLGLKNGLILTLDEEKSFSITKDKKKYEIMVLPVWKWLVENSKSSKNALREMRGKIKFSMGLEELRKDE